VIYVFRAVQSASPWKCPSFALQSSKEAAGFPGAQALELDGPGVGVG
jgi:hypothetical protein